MFPLNVIDDEMDDGLRIERNQEGRGMPAAAAVDDNQCDLERSKM